MTKPQKFTARLEEKIVHNPNYTEFHFELVSPPTMENQAGQYVMIDVPNPNSAENGQPPLVKRAYSMCDRPDINHGFEIILSTVAPGLGVNYLTSLNFGDQIDLMGPLGLFVLDPPDSAKALTFVATGSGIAPIKAMIADLLQLRLDPRPIRLYWGMYHETDYFWLEDLLDWQRAFPNFTFIPVVENPTEVWTLSRGRVTDSLLVDGVTDPSTEFYLCGNPHMITDVTNLITTQFNVPISQVHREQF